MHAPETAKEFLRTRFEPRLDAIRGAAPGGKWVDITNFHLPFNEAMPDSCRLAPAPVTTETDHG